MIATMSRSKFKREITGGLGCRSRRVIPGSIKLEELLHPRETARRAEELRLRREAREAAQREEAQRHSEYEATVQELRDSLPPVGSVIRVEDSFLTANVCRARFGVKERLFVLSRIVGEYPAEPMRILVGSKTNQDRALRCFLNYGSFTKVMQKTRGYLDFAGITAVKVISHSTSGQAVNVKIAEQ